jgi:hypothetical protein
LQHQSPRRSCRKLTSENDFAPPRPPPRPPLPRSLALSKHFRLSPVERKPMRNEALDRNLAHLEELECDGERTTPGPLQTDLVHHDLSFWDVRYRYRVRILARLFKARALGSRFWDSGFGIDLCEVSGREACKSRLEDEGPARLGDSQGGVEAHFTAGAVNHNLPLSTLWQLRHQHSLDPVGLRGSMEFRVSCQWTGASQQRQSLGFSCLLQSSVMSKNTHLKMI